MIMKTTLNDSNSASILNKLSRANAEFAAAYPGDSAERQPVHTVYGGAHLFRSDSAAALGRKALEALRQYAPDAGTLADALGLSKTTADVVYARVAAKLEREPVEDYRIDFEDGFGIRLDSEEDAEADRTAHEMARAMQNGTLPPFVGIRIKPLNALLRA